MGFSEKAQVMDGVIVGISLRAPLKPIRTNSSVEKERESDGEECSTTPTSEESRISSKLMCPPAPRKRKPASRCNYNNVREFFTTPPDLESVFIRHVERANS